MPGQGKRTQYGAAKPKPKPPNYSNLGRFDNDVTTAFRRAADQAYGTGNYEYTKTAEDAWLRARGDIATGRNTTYPTDPASPGGGISYGGGGGRGGGGGGGGGGLTQAIIDAMARAMGGQGPQLTLQQADLPAFRGQNLPAFNAAPWQQMLGQIDTAVTADQANIQQNQQQLQQTLQNNYSNPYAQATVTPGATAAPMGAGLMGTAGGQASAAPAQQANAQNADSQASFQNLLGVLAAADQQSQNSRMAQVPMDANYATQGLNAQALGMRGQVGMAQTQAQQQWAAQDAERRYQNSLMRQQWNREEMLNNQSTANQQRTANYSTNAQNWQARLQPILDLISQSAGTSGLNFESIFKMLGV